MKKQAQKEQIAVCDKLIKAFQSKPQNEWRTLIAYSKQWPTLADKVFSRCAQPLKLCLHHTWHLSWVYYYHLLDWGSRGDAGVGDSHLPHRSRTRYTMAVVLVTSA